MYCKVSQNKWGENIVTVVNTLGVVGFEDSSFQEGTGQDAVGALDNYANDVRQGFRRSMAKSSDSAHGLAKASDSNYQNTVCECTKDVSRYNADLAGEDCNRSEGKVVILATVHDTFPVPKKKRVFWVSFPDMETTLAFRREVCLNNPKDLPISCEYMDRDSVDIIDRSGRIGVHMIKNLGMGDIMGFLWGIKVAVEGLPFSFAPLLPGYAIFEVLLAYNPTIIFFGGFCVRLLLLRFFMILLLLSLLFFPCHCLFFSGMHSWQKCLLPCTSLPSIPEQTSLALTQGFFHSS